MSIWIVIYETYESIIGVDSTYTTYAAALKRLEEMRQDDEYKRIEIEESFVEN